MIGAGAAATSAARTREELVLRANPLRTLPVPEAPMPPPLPPPPPMLPRPLAPPAGSSVVSLPVPREDATDRWDDDSAPPPPPPRVMLLLRLPGALPPPAVAPAAEEDNEAAVVVDVVVWPVLTRDRTCEKRLGGGTGTVCLMIGTSGGGGAAGGAADEAAGGTAAIAGCSMVAVAPAPTRRWCTTARPLAGPLAAAAEEDAVGAAWCGRPLLALRCCRARWWGVGT